MKMWSPRRTWASRPAAGMRRRPLSPPQKKDAQVQAALRLLQLGVRQ